MHSEILRIALPSIVSNITVPLLGLVDVAIVGHMGNSVYIGAIAIGSMIFNVICWIFGFLRMGSSGMTSQAYGAGDRSMIADILVRSLFIGLLTGVLFILFQPLVRGLAMTAMSPTADILPYACQYFDICIWALPAMLCLFGLNGWLIGMQNTRIPMYVSLFQNVVNILGSMTFVYVFGMKVEGVALGTLVAQYGGLLLMLLILSRKYRAVLAVCTWRAVKDSAGMRRFFVVNRDIFIRNLFLVAVNFAFTAIGARQGAVVLAVNTLMYQFFTLYSYVMDGFAYAGEAIGGKYYGAGDMRNFHLSVRCLFKWGTALCLAYTLLYYIGGMQLMRLLSDNSSVISSSEEYMPWVYLLPLAGMGAFIWDGLYVGITDSRGMLFSLLVSAVVFFVISIVFFDIFRNHALWLALILYLSARGIVQTVLWKNKFGRQIYRNLRK